MHDGIEKRGIDDFLRASQVPKGSVVPLKFPQFHVANYALL